MTEPRVEGPWPIARGSHGAVVAPNHLATGAGLAILRAGGSAVDAAIATNAVLGVVQPASCGIGGDGFWLIWDAAAGRQVALNGSGRAGSRADAAFLRASGLTEIPAVIREIPDEVVRIHRTCVECFAVDELPRSLEGCDDREGHVADVDQRAPGASVALQPNRARRHRPAHEVVEHDVEP